MDSAGAGELPPLRPSTPTNHPRRLLRRKRSHRSSASSEAPVFSSDDLAEATSENYLTSRRKKQHRRPWWASDSNIDVMSSRHASKRFLDSGVWLSSDSSTDDGFSSEAFGLGASPSMENTPRAVKKPKVKAEPASLQYAREVVEQCVDTNQETVDLCSCGLSDIPNDILRPLKHLIRLPRNNAASDFTYHSFRPSLQLFLASNLLQKPPAEVFNLENLTVLSLRNNRITKLPHTIGKLVNLKELNLAGNALQCLPWELLKLMGSDGQLTTMNLTPNPFVLPFHISTAAQHIWSFPSPAAKMNEMLEGLTEGDQPAQQDPHDQMDHASLLKWLINLAMTFRDRMIAFEDTIKISPTWPQHSLKVQQDLYQQAWKRDPIFLGSTSPTSLTPHGSPWTDLPEIVSDRGRTIAPPEVVSSNAPTDQTIGSRPPRSLFELALQACYDSLYVSDFTPGAIPDFPENVEQALQIAREVAIEGGRVCSVCQRSYIVPRIEWLEYWHLPLSYNQTCPQDELFIPFERRGCSWSCRAS